MDSQIQHGYIILADISGFTSFMEETEITHSSSILSNIIELIIKQLTPTLNLAEVEGDAVFAYAAESQVSRGELLLEIIEATYAAFRDNQRTMQHNVTCPCKACQTISSLDLKFITHYGDYVLQNVAGKNKPVGSVVNVVHRLLKNNVNETTGWTGYALFSKKSLEQMRISPAGMHETLESYEHLGEVNASSINLDEGYRELVNERQVFLTAKNADASVTHEFSAPPAVVWDWLNDPAKRTRWQKGSAWELKERPSGRTGPAAQNHCTTAKVIEQVLDWRPFKYYTVKYSMGMLNLTITGELKSTAIGTHYQCNMKLNGPIPRWIRQRLSRRMVNQKWHLKDNLGVMAKLIGEAKSSV